MDAGTWFLLWLMVSYLFGVWVTEVYVGKKGEKGKREKDNDSKPGASVGVGASSGVQAEWWDNG